MVIIYGRETLPLTRNGRQTGCVGEYSAEKRIWTPVKKGWSELHEDKTASSLLLVAYYYYYYYYYYVDQNK